MRKTMCNECRYTFALKEESIETECIDIDRKIERQFYKCPNCGHKYTILITDQPMRDMINQRRAIAIRIQKQRQEIEIRIQKLAEKKQIVKIKKLEKKDESLKEQIWERGQELKKEFDGRGMT